MKRLLVLCVFSVCSFGAYADNLGHHGQSELNFAKHLDVKSFGEFGGSLSKIHYSFEDASLQEHSSSKSKFSDETFKKGFAWDSRFDKSVKFDPRWERAFEDKFWSHKGHDDFSDWGGKYHFNCTDPVPEPETYWMFMIGLIMIVTLAKRYNKN